MDGLSALTCPSAIGNLWNVGLGVNISRWERSKTLWADIPHTFNWDCCKCFTFKTFIKHFTTIKKYKFALTSFFFFYSLSHDFVVLYVFILKSIIWINNWTRSSSASSKLIFLLKIFLAKDVLMRSGLELVVSSVPS